MERKTFLYFVKKPRPKTLSRLLGSMFFAFLLACLPLRAEAQTRMTLRLKNATLEEALVAIKQHSSYGFFYTLDEDEVKKMKKINLDLLNADIKEAMRQVLKGTDFTYTIVNNVVIIKEKKRVAAKKAQNKQKPKNTLLVGKVIDDNREPLPGVSVRLKGTTKGTTTDANGLFFMNISNADRATLSFSFIGMKNKEVDWRDEETLTVMMEGNTQSVDEIVVNGYQTLDRRDMVGAHSVLKADDILRPAYNSIDQMLQGRVAGLMVTNTSSRVGTSPSITLRGTSTLLGNQSPLWVVDGIVQEDPITIDVSSAMTQNLEDIIGSQASWLNPMDIETITVLKDASATAIYGSKASNGVIVITTKRGKMGQMSINYSGNISFNTRPNYGMFNYMNSQERIQFSEDAFNAGVRYSSEPYADPYTYEGAMRMYIAGDMTKQEYTQRKAFLERNNTDWFKLLTRSAVSHNHNLSIRGGNEKAMYNVSVGYNKSLGQEVGNDNDKMTARVSTDIYLTPRFRINATLNATSSKTNSFGGSVSPITYATETSRSVPAYDEQGQPVYYLRSSKYYTYNSIRYLGYNFLNEREHSGAESKNLYAAANLNLRWTLTDWLTYEFVGGYTVNNTNSESYADEQTYYIAENYRGYDYDTVEPTDPLYKAAMLPHGGVIVTADGYQRSYNIQNKLLFSRTFNKNHRLNAMLAMELRSSQKKVNSNTVFGYLADRGQTAAVPTAPDDFTSMGYGTISGWGILQSLYNGAWKRTAQTDNFLSYFATLAYSFKDRYVFNFSLRNDLSNRFGQDVRHRFDPTYSLGGSWNATEESWMKRVNRTIHNLSLRVTYGIQGNALTNVSPELILQRGSIDGDYKQFTSTVYRLPNPELSWEKTRSWNIGMDLGLFHFFDLTFDYYRRRSNAVVSQEIAYENGKDSMQKNGGMITNRGLELTVSFTPLHTRDWALNVSLNSSRNWNKLGYTDFAPTLTQLLNGSTSRILKQGYPLGAFWSYSFAGINQEDGSPMFNFIDVDDDQRSATVDPLTFLVYSGSTQPDFTGGLSLSLRWKEFTLATNFALILGGKKRLPSPYENTQNGMYMPDPTVNLSRDLLKRWQHAGDETNIPGFVTSNQTGMLVLPNTQTVAWMEMWAYSDALVVNGSFLRCTDLSLTWRMASAMCRKIGLKSLSVNGSVSNLFVIASKRFNGFDPELGNSVQPKYFSIGMNVGF